MACLKELEEEDIWLSPNSHLNSIGNLILHLCGNIRQYVISSLGGDSGTRERDLEFSTRGGFTKAELAEKLYATIEKAKSIIIRADPENLLRKRKTQGTIYSGIGIVIHITEHYSYHSGQVIFMTKLIKNKDLGFYNGINLNQKNE
jgi:uncharacterized damage-inducible protein DinB